MIRKALGIMSLVSALAVGGGVFAAPGDPVIPPANNQVISRDAIALRVVPNPEHFSPLQWYNSNIKIKGAPQSLIVDGYEAVRDGRTVYVNAAKVTKVNRCDGNGAICTNSRQCPQVKDPQTSLPRWLIPTAQAAAGSCVVSSIPELYTNIYIISYNQDPEAATTDIFGQLLQFWKFNPDLKNCSNNPDRYCTENNECSASSAPGGSVETCQPTGICSKSEDKLCLLDGDCPNGEYCHNKKSAVVRDVKRLADLRTAKDRLEAYADTTAAKRYPSLEQGTYLSGRTISLWPSWQETFKNALGASPGTDPINLLGPCVGRGTYNAVTCWDEGRKEYGGTADPLALPAKSYAYYYQYKAADNSFRFCGITESGFIQGKAVGSSICQTNNCASCDDRQCGGNGCGQSCGTCAAGFTCNANFRCVKSGQIGIGDIE